MPLGDGTPWWCSRARSRSSARRAAHYAGKKAGISVWRRPGPETLSGLITGFAARGATIEQASAWGVALHAHAGAVAARAGALGYLAREFAGEVPAIMQALMRKSRPS
jgi:hypothetical protein